MLQIYFTKASCTAQKFLRFMAKSFWELRKNKDCRTPVKDLKGYNLDPMKRVQVRCAPLGREQVWTVWICQF